MKILQYRMLTAIAREDARALKKYFARLFKDHEGHEKCLDRLHQAALAVIEAHKTGWDCDIRHAAHMIRFNYHEAPIITTDRLEMFAVVRGRLHGPPNNTKFKHWEGNKIKIGRGLTITDYTLR